MLSSTPSPTIRRNVDKDTRLKSTLKPTYSGHYPLRILCLLISLKKKKSTSPDGLL